MEGIKVKVDTRWFGTIDIDDEKIITFDLGVIGFEDCKKFTLIYDVDKGDEASIMWLQSLDEPELALPMLKPELIKEDYDPIVEDEMLKALGSDIKEADLADLEIDKVGDSNAKAQIVKLYELAKKEAGIKIQEETPEDSAMKAVAMMADAKVF